MNLEPIPGKQKWRSCSSQPTPRETKLISLEPPFLFAELQEKKSFNVPSLAFTNSIPIQCYPAATHGHTNI